MLQKILFFPTIILTIIISAQTAQAQNDTRRMFALLGGGVFSNLGSINVNGAATHASVGYDRFFPAKKRNPFFIGVDASIGYIFSEENIEEKQDGIQYTTDFSTLARIGYQDGHNAFYAQGGYGWSIIKERPGTTGRRTNNRNATIHGVRFGVGTDYVVFETYALRFDYLYSVYQEKTLRSINQDTPIDGGAHLLRFGIVRYF